MTIKTKVLTNFDFNRLLEKTKTERLILDMAVSGAKVFSHLGAKSIKNNILRGDFAPLRESTIRTRRAKGISGSAPLLATGKLYTSIKDTPDGVEMLRYGVRQHQGFIPEKIPYKSLLSKHQNKVWFVNNKNNIPVPARPFITPPPQAYRTAQVSVVEAIRTFMRKAGYSRFGG